MGRRGKWRGQRVAYAFISMETIWMPEGCYNSETRPILTLFRSLHALRWHTAASEVLNGPLPLCLSAVWCQRGCVWHTNCWFLLWSSKLWERPDWTFLESMLLPFKQNNILRARVTSSSPSPLSAESFLQLPESGRSRANICAFEICWVLISPN